VEEIIESRAWKCGEVQESLALLNREMPGTGEWNKQAADVIYEYQEAMERFNERGLVEKSDGLGDMLKSGGSLYEARRREIGREIGRGGEAR
jgi:hypothetical protein